MARAGKRTARRRPARRRKSSGWWWKLGLVALVAAGSVLVYLDANIRTTFSGKKWAVSAMVFARPLELFEGMAIARADVEDELKRLSYDAVFAVNAPGQYKVSGDVLHIYTRGFRFPDGEDPPRQLVVRFDDGLITGLRASDGADLVRLEALQIGGIYPAHNEDRLLVRLEDVPKPLQGMLIATEDQDFYSHWGVSPTGILRAMWVNLSSGKMTQGGSTLTQQLVKNFYLSAERSLARKGLEAVMAVLLELHFSKEEILEAYLNEIYLAQDGSRAVHGFGLASQYFFNKPLSSLALHEQALLVGLVRGPSYYNPWRNPERALEHRNLILDVAEREGVITAYEAAQARSRSLGVGSRMAEHRKRYPAYLDLVRAQLQRDYRESDLVSSGLSIFTHFDPRVQRQAETSLGNVIEQLENSGRAATKNLQGAVVVTRPNTGAVLAVVGGKDVRFDGFNRALDAKRQVGSVIKPAVYLTALERPTEYTLATLLDDTEFELRLPNGDTWAPKNFDKTPHGQVMLFHALANSYNLATARLAQAVGIDNLVSVLRRLGVAGDLPEVASLALGAATLTPLDVTQMYQTLAGEGFYTPLLAIDAVVNSNGEVLSRYALDVEERFAPEVIYQLRYALEAVTTEGTAKSLAWRLPDFRVAGKTGTTDDSRDSWFAGFSGDLLAVVWLGHDDNSPTGLTGSTGALPVWSDIMARMSSLPIQNIQPEAIVMGWVDDDTGRAAGEGCANSRPLPFRAGTQPATPPKCRNGAFDRFRQWLN